MSDFSPEITVDTLEQLEMADVIELHENDYLIAIHVLPDVFPINKRSQVSFIRPEKSLRKDKPTILFAGADTSELGHEGLLEIALEEDIIDDGQIIGGGVIDTQNARLIRSSRAFGEVDPQVLSKFQDLLEEINS